MNLDKERADALNQLKKDRADARFAAHDRFWAAFIWTGTTGLFLITCWYTYQLITPILP